MVVEMCVGPPGQKTYDVDRWEVLPSELGRVESFCTQDGVCGLVWRALAVRHRWPACGGSVWWRVLMAGFTKSGSTVSITVTGHRKSSATPSSASSAALEHRALQDHT